MLAQINFEIISKRSWQFGEVIESSVIARFAFNGLFAKVREVGNNSLTITLSMKSCFVLAINHLSSSHPPHRSWYRFLLSLLTRPSTGHVLLSPRSCFGVCFLISHCPSFTSLTATRKGAPGRFSRAQVTRQHHTIIRRRH